MDISKKLECEIMDIKTQIIEQINDASNIAIIMHDNPDADAIGSAIALEEILKQLNKNTAIITQNKIKKKYAQIFGKSRVNKYYLPNFYFDVLFVLDCSEQSRISIKLKDYSDNIIVIDHHKNFNPYGTIYWQENKISNSILIFYLIKELIKQKYNVFFTEIIATALYMGISGDSFNFRNLNTTAETHQISAELIEYGADLEYVNEIEKYSRSILKLEKQVWDNLIYDEQYKIIYAVISPQTIKDAKSTYEDASQIINVMRLISDVDVAIVFIPFKNKVYIKTRSHSINVSRIMKLFGGGGHELAAGAVCYSDTTFSVVNSVIKKVKEAIDISKRQAK